ncbi:hypothetical protein PoB_000761100 [Plakobranchus ocellatus]|uniref:Uncharacterized protein n=1 Tax=Plakobranchus ocellatus TaxID=259542 RepID=A0AAV3YD41_9GAST|nr:hypothetical protein PoB_000761100 [Plakobranchus ocellatus]
MAEHSEQATTRSDEGNKKEISIAVQLVHAIIEKWRTNMTEDDETDSFASEMARGLTVAGISQRGQEVVEMHALLLKSLLDQPCKPVDSSPLPENCITWKEYFQLLTNNELAWHEIAHHTVPFMTLGVANCYLQHLLEHVTCKIGGKGVTPQDVALCVLGLNIGLGFILDLLLLQENPDNGE